MRMLFEGYWWHKGPFANRAVQRDLILTWHKDYPDDDIFVAVRKKDSGGAPLTDEGIQAVHTRAWPQAISNMVELGLLARSLNADAVLAHNYTPFGCRATTFIHDVMFVEHPEWFSRKERIYFWPMLPSARAATVVLTSTQTEAQRIHRASGGKVVATATGLAVPRSLADAVPSRPADAPDPGSFAVVVGRLNVRKNLGAVIRGAGVSTRITPDTPLLVVGAAEYSGRGMSLADDLSALVQSGAVRFLGRTSDEELAWLYANSALSISLSLDEGFGLPAIEAAHFGSPLLASDISVFRETVGDYAHFVEPSAPPAALGAAIDSAWGHEPDRLALDEIKSRYNWSSVVSCLRGAIETSLAQST